MFIFVIQASQKLNQMLGPLFEDETVEPEEKTEKFAKDYAEEIAASGDSSIEITYPEG